jgi:hypothetical protein
MGMALVILLQQCRQKQYTRERKNNNKENLEVLGDLMHI